MKTLDKHIKDRIRSCNENAWAALRETEAQIWVQKRKALEGWLSCLDDNLTREFSLAEFNTLVKIHQNEKV